jgi:hypothetical protein
VSIALKLCAGLLGGGGGFCIADVYVTCTLDFEYPICLLCVLSYQYLLLCETAIIRLYA